MSDTDKTRPWWVRVSERAHVSAHPSHDHRRGPCDLPATPYAWYADGTTTRCGWRESDAMLYGRGSGCGCGWCAGQLAHTRQSRADRRRVNAQLDAMIRTNDFDADVPTRRPPSDW